LYWEIDSGNALRDENPDGMLGGKDPLTSILSPVGRGRRRWGRSSLPEEMKKNLERSSFLGLEGEREREKRSPLISILSPRVEGKRVG